MKFQTTGKTKISSVKCCLLFDAADGSIAHVHRVVTYVGAEETPEHLIEKRTLQLARELGLDTSKLQLIHVDDNKIEHGFKYSVDLKSKDLIKSKKITI